MRKEIPILYSTFMAQAKIAWRKTQTRRIAKKHPGNEFPNDIHWNNTTCSFSTYYSEDYAGDGTDKKLGPIWLILDEDGEFEGFLGDCPYGQVGDWLYGRECTAQWAYPEKEPFKYAYKADGFIQRYGAWERDTPNKFHDIERIERWAPSIHMPKVAARIWDEVTGIRVERIADISEEDCIAEGIELVGENLEFGGEFYSGKWYKNYLPEGYTFLRPYDSYRSLWQFLNGKPKLKGDHYEVYPFDERHAQEFAGLTTWRGKPLTVITNPWVWVIESKQLSVTGKP